MEVSAWSNGKVPCGIRVGTKNRRLHFQEYRKENAVKVPIEVTIDGNSRTLYLTVGFWNKCPEIRGAPIRDWLKRLKKDKWEKGNPPRFELLPLGGRRFRLSGKEE